MKEIPAFGVEARRWTVVFHRKAENRLFSLIALGHFKHVSAFAWLPELGIWQFYDVGFRRTRLRCQADGVHAHATIASLCAGNCAVTIETREDNLPLMRLGMFCTTAVAHLVGVRCVALRPDGLYRSLIAQGGVVSDDAAQRPAPGSG